MSKPKIVFLFGGQNSEYEISLKSTYSILTNISSKKYEIILIGITKKGKWLYFPGHIKEIKNDTWYKNKDCTPAIISPCKTNSGIFKILDGSYKFEKIDLVFPVLHGKNGEDGKIQGLLELSGIPFVGCDSTSSAICMDKIITNTLLDKNNINHTKWYSFNFNKEKNKDIKDFIPKIESNLKYPMYIKPSCSGSSVGISKANNTQELIRSIMLALCHDTKILIEEEIKGRELEVAVMGNFEPVVSSIGEIIFEKDFYDYEEKYINGTSKTIIVNDLKENIEKQIKELSIKAYKVLGCTGLSRIDFFLTKDNKIYLNEVNTLPGFTEISMFPKLFINDGISFSEIIDNLINFAFEKTN